MARNRGHRAPADIAADESKNMSHNTLNYRDFIIYVNHSGWQNDLYSLNTHTKREIVFTRGAPAFDILSVLTFELRFIILF